MPVERLDPDDVNSGDIGSSEWINALPRGKIARDILRDNSDSTDGTAAGVTIMSCTTTVPAGREIDVTACVTLRTDAPGGVRVTLRMDGDQIQRKNHEFADATKDLSYTLFAQTQPDAGEHTWTVVIGNSGSTTNVVTAVANGVDGSHGTCDLKVVDTGPALVDA